MSDPSPPLAPLAWVIKIDGRQVPFEADKISRSLFAASATLGRPDTFLCRELTDSVLHFLDAEFRGQIPTTSVLAELIVKVVRELGHPELAREYELFRSRQPTIRESGTPAADDSQQKWNAIYFVQQLTAAANGNASAVAQQVSALQGFGKLYSPDILAAHVDGLIHLGGPGSGERVEAVLVSPETNPAKLIERVTAYRQGASDVLVFDSPDVELWTAGGARNQSLQEWLQGLREGLGKGGCRAILNLNRAGAGVAANSGGTLFGPDVAGARGSDRRAFSLEMVEKVARSGSKGVRIDWHLCEEDFSVENVVVLQVLTQLATAGSSITFVFDRPRQKTRLVEGLAIGQNAILTSIGLGLPQLARHMGNPPTPERFLTKLGSLVRLALSAATQKRSYLRAFKKGQPIFAQGFFLENAKVVLVPLALDAVVAELTGQPCSSRTPTPLSFACDILECIQHAATEDGRALLFDTVIDSPLYDDFAAAPADRPELVGQPTYQPGVTVWDSVATLSRQLSVIGTLQEVVRGGTCLIHPLQGIGISPEEMQTALRFAWEKTAIRAVRFVLAARPEVDAVRNS